MPVKVSACEITGCSVSNGLVGISPQFNRNFVGFRYGVQSMRYGSEALAYDGQTGLRQDVLSRVELYGRFFAGNRWIIQAAVPYVFNKRVTNAGRENIQGPSDVSLSVHGLLLNQQDSANGKFSQVLMLGMQTTLPSGKYQIRNQQMIQYPEGLQPGTGSYRFAPQLIYSLRLKYFGLLADASFTTSSTNEQLLRPGNNVAAGFSFFIWKIWKDWSFMPQLGLRYDSISATKRFGFYDVTSAYEQLNSNITVDVFFNRFALNISAIMPISVRQMSHSTQYGARIQGGVLFSF